MSAGVDIMNSGIFDKLMPIAGGSGSLGSVGSMGSSVLSGLSSTNPWVLGANLLGGMLSNRDTSAANAAGGASQLNTSGWVVGEGDATGGTLSSVPTIPWYAWVAVAVVTYAVIRKKKGG